ncbi:N-acetylglucosamine-6-phosphate deacetylase [Harmonia axyridis]|uniref:N-acetylglucosamine-6-phosphate deacetylase n=1 Tax=Harmonia axyridis TaxID=115357 RepID=UPI001E27759D|nr:N-acetylglucosamine-6-phosphate deacetylase [Harmonia axyridis]
MTLKNFFNCRILRNHEIIDEQLWVRNGKIIDPEKIFFDEKSTPDVKIDCGGLIIAPGFIDIQINGGYGVDFSHDTENIQEAVALVAGRIIENGVTSFCPTIVTSPVPVYRSILPKIQRTAGGSHGASILGIHVEGPFISPEKKGAHPPHCIREYSKGFDTVELAYGSFENISIVTLAPELLNSEEIIRKLVERHIIVSLGHSVADLNQGEEACRNGATLITHLFNAMLGFHHRDPGLVGLLTSEKIPKPIFYGLISDGIHTHPAAVRVAYKSHPDGVVLVTDAIAALGLADGQYHLGQLDVEVRGERAMLLGTDVLCGSTSNLNQCVQKFHKFTKCSKAFALEAASLHPAKALGIENHKGTLNYGADADFIFLNDDLHVQSTWIAGEKVFPSFS